MSIQFSTSGLVLTQKGAFAWAFDAWPELNRQPLACDGRQLPVQLVLSTVGRQQVAGKLCSKAGQAPLDAVADDAADVGTAQRLQQQGAEGNTRAVRTVTACRPGERLAQ